MITPADYKAVQVGLIGLIIKIKSNNPKVKISELCICVCQEANNLREVGPTYLRDMALGLADQDDREDQTCP